MAKIKIIWFDNSISYIGEKGKLTAFIEDAKEYKTILIASRSARIYKRNNYNVIKDVKIIENNKEYNIF